MKPIFPLSLMVVLMITIISCKRENNPPIMKDQIFSVKENSTPGLVCATISASDADNDHLTYKLEEENANFPFEVDPNTGNLKIKLTTNLDYELVQQYRFQVKVSDKHESASAIITINLTDQVEIPNVVDQSFDINENIEGIYSIGVVKFKSKGQNDEISFRIIEGNSSNLFFVGEKSGELFLSKAERLDYEGGKSYSLLIKIQNLTNPELYAVITVGIDVVDVNEKPTIMDQSFSILENSQNSTEIGLLIASDVDAGQSLNYNILQSSMANAVNVDASTGKLSILDKSKFDFEANNKIILAIKVTDNGTGGLSDTANVTINITDLNENPVIATKNLHVDENSAAGKEVGKVTANSYTEVPIEYSIVAGDVTGIFSINKNSGMISVAQSGLLNYETKNSYSLTIKVNEIANPKFTSNAAITIDLNDVNEHPVITDALFHFKESEASGTVLGRVVASDPDGGQPLLYSITSGNEDGYFSIDPSNGNLLLAKPVVTNGNDEITFVLKVQVKDNAMNPLAAEANVTITLSKMSIPDNGLVAYYLFNGNANDEGIYKYDGDLVGPLTTSDRKEMENSAFSFDGYNDYIKLSSQVGNEIRTISLWFRLDVNINSQLANAVALVHREGDANNYTQYSLGFRPTTWPGNAGKLIFSNSSKSEYFNIDSNSSTWEKDRWYHVVAIIDPLEGMKMYIDNVKQTDTFLYNNPTSTSEINTYVGSWERDPNRYFKGKIDDLIFYNRALTKAEVNELYQQ